MCIRDRFWGRQLTGSTEWRLRLDRLELSLTVEGRTHRVSVEEESAYRIKTGAFWADIDVYKRQQQDVLVTTGCPAFGDGHHLIFYQRTRMLGRIADRGRAQDELRSHPIESTDPLQATDDIGHMGTKDLSLIHI